MADDGKGLLEKLLEEVAAKQRAHDESSDFAINLTSTDKDGATHSVQGVPISQARRFLYDKFGIGDPPEAGDGDEGQGDKGDGKGGGGATPLKRYFGQTG